MDAHYHIARAGRVEGPFDWASLLQLVANGGLATSDFVHRAGSTDWQPAWHVPDLFPVMVAPEVGPRIILTDCFGCFDTVEVTIAAGATSAPCPRCDTSVQVEAPGVNASEQFVGLDGDFKERIDRRVADAYAARAAENGILLSIVKKAGNM